MFFKNYSLLQDFNNHFLAVQWMTPDLLAWRWVGMALVLLALAVFFFPRPVASFLDKHQHIHSVTARHLALWSPVASMAGGLMIFIARPPTLMIQWLMTEEKIAVRSLRGHTEIPWTDVAFLYHDPREKDVEKSPLVIRDKNGKEIWLVLKWIAPDSAEKVVQFITARAPNKLLPPGQGPGLQAISAVPAATTPHTPPTTPAPKPPRPKRQPSN